MPKRRKAGIVKWLKTITGIEVDEKTSKKKSIKGCLLYTSKPVKKNNEQLNVDDKKKSPIKEIVKEKKVKKEIPTRAKNDPRQTS